MNFQISMGGNHGFGGGFGQQIQHPPPQPSPHYGAHQQTHQANVFGAAAWQAMNFSSEDDFRLVFERNKNQALNGLQGQELYNILNTHNQIKNYYGIAWSMELCKIMLAMMDRNKNGIMQYEEFQELLHCLVFWKNTFHEYDVDRSGYIEAEEMYKCILTKYDRQGKLTIEDYIQLCQKYFTPALKGYKLSQKAMETLLKRYSRVHMGRCLLAFDDFVSLSVRLRAYTEAFRARDRQCNGGNETGMTAFGYDDFIQCVMCL